MLDWMPKWFALSICPLAIGLLGYMASFKLCFFFGHWEGAIGGASIGLFAGLVMVVYDLVLGRDDEIPEGGEADRCDSGERDGAASCV